MARVPTNRRVEQVETRVSTSSEGSQAAHHAPVDAIGEYVRHKMPQQNRGESRQDYVTPMWFIRLVEVKFGPIVFDLAASVENARAPAFYDEQADALKQDWTKIRPGNRWLNPPFADIRPWAACCERFKLPKFEDKRIIMLTPASVDTEWFADHVMDTARVVFLRGRIPFDGQPVNPKTGKVDGYPKGLMLSIYGDPPGFETWKWGDDLAKTE